MISILTYILVFTVCGFVIYPLLRGQDSIQAKTSEKSSRILDLLFQKRLYAETIEDLTFDHQTGKLSEEDLEQLLVEQQQAYNRVKQQIENLTDSNRNQLRQKLEEEIKRKVQKLQKDISVCATCGNQVNKNDKFCSHCGAKLN